MKPVSRGLLLLIHLATAIVALAAGHYQGSHGFESCNSWEEDVALPCQRIQVTDDSTVAAKELCCRALAAANERGCFCEEDDDGVSLPISSSEKRPLSSFGGRFCELRIFFQGSKRCSKLRSLSVAPVHRLPSLHGIRKLVQDQVSSVAHHNTSSEDLQNKDENDQQTTTDAGLSGIMAAGFMGSLVISCAYVCPCWKPKKKPENDSFKHDISINSISSHDARSIGTSLNSGYSGSDFTITAAHLPAHPSGGGLTFTMAELMKVTGNFSPSHKIGQGGFGTVYKGKLRDGTIVAVKRAKKDASDSRMPIEFQTEVAMLSQVDHLNLVKFIGSLDEGSERIIVVEFVPNGNLREHLDGLFERVLDMATRLDIAIDIAHALTYLHLYADRPIIHRDVKASNILLTDTYRAKVADFGFSRTGPTDQGATHISTQVKGTAGYLDPEYLTTYQLNQKSDVYSFGILLIEIFTGRRPIELKRPSDERVTVRWAFKKFVEGKVMDILDPRLEKSSAIYVIMERLAELAFACSAPTKTDRPSMKKAQEALWQIRKDYQAQTAGDPGRSPSRGIFTPGSHSTYTIMETDSRASPSLLSPHLSSPARSNAPMSPGATSATNQSTKGKELSEE